MNYFVTYISSLAAFLGIDAIWLGLVAKNYYFTQLGNLMVEKFNLLGAGLFYLIFPVGVIIFSTTRSETLFQAIVYGALFGFFTYATYDLTNLAVLKSWPLALTFIDILWGTVLTAVTSAIAFIVFKKF